MSKESEESKRTPRLRTESDGDLGRDMEGIVCRGGWIVRNSVLLGLRARCLELDQMRTEDKISSRREG